MWKLKWPVTENSVYIKLQLTVPLLLSWDACSGAVPVYNVCCTGRVRPGLARPLFFAQGSHNTNPVH